MSDTYLFSGYLPAYSTPSKFLHTVGGMHHVVGAECPNCAKPLMLHLTLDMADQRVHIDSVNLAHLRLFYCSRCSLSWHPFCYTLVDDSSIIVQTVYRGETKWDDWYDDGGTDQFPERRFDLVPVPSGLQTLCNKLNRGCALSIDETRAFATYTNAFASQDCGAYPIVDVFTQIGGRSFLSQRLDDPICDICHRNGKRERMRFLASMVNDAKNEIRISFQGVQIVFFFCRKCRSVQVVHSV
jgi:hypothetical protein